MEQDFNTGLRKSLEYDRVKLTRRRKQLLREMGYSEDLDSSEIAEKLHEQTLANGVLNRSIVRYEEEIAKLKSRIAELETGRKPVAKTSANSGCFRTEDSIENYATVASVIQTQVQNGQNPFEILRVIATLAGAQNHLSSHHYREVMACWLRLG